MRTIIPILFVVILTGSNGDSGVCEKSSKQVHSRLKNHLLCDYDRTLRPRINHRNATQVTVLMILQSFLFDMHSNAIIVNSWTPIEWVDDHLKWNSTDYEGVKSIRLNSNEIWTPDISIINRHDEERVQRIFNYDADCIVDCSGRVQCVPPSKYAALCKADLTKFPYDIQSCSVWLSSWTQKGEEIDIRLAKRAMITDDYESTEWKLLNTSSAKDPGIYKCCPDETYPTIGFLFTIQRNPSFHEAAIVIPIIVILMLNLLALCLTIVDINRFSLLIANTLFHLLFIGLLCIQLPSAGVKPPNILILVKDSLIVCTAELIITVILQRLIKTKIDDIGWMALIMDFAVTSRLGQTILLFNASIKTNAMLNGAADGSNLIEISQSPNNFILFAKLVDRLLLFIFVIIYLCVFISFIP